MSEDYAQNVSKIRNPAVKAIVEKAVETFDGYVVSAETVEAIPIDYLNSRISRLRQHRTYAGDFAADLLEAIIKDYNKEAHNEQTE